MFELIKFVRYEKFSKLILPYNEKISYSDSLSIIFLLSSFLFHLKYGIIIVPAPANSDVGNSMVYGRNGV